MLLGLPEIVVVLYGSQLSEERPSALERRSAISGLIRLVPVRMRFSVEAATSSFPASSRPLNVVVHRLPKAVRWNAGLDFIQCGALWDAYSIGRKDSIAETAVDTNGSMVN